MARERRKGHPIFDKKKTIKENVSKDVNERRQKLNEVVVRCAMSRKAERIALQDEEEEENLKN